MENLFQRTALLKKEGNVPGIRFYVIDDLPKKGPGCIIRIKIEEGKNPQHSAQYLPFSGGPSFFFSATSETSMFLLAKLEQLKNPSR